MGNVVRSLAFAALMIGNVLVWIGIIVALVLAGPLVGLGYLFLDAADDLDAGWRRGREQNWLWRWAHRHRGHM